MSRHYPLQWPKDFPRSKVFQGAAFQQNLDKAMKALEREMRLMGATNLVLSSNVSLGEKNPSDKGVCAYFTWDKLELAIPCDKWDKVHDNVYAIAKTIEAMRGMERWGAKHMIRQMFIGFKALPERTGAVYRSWWEVLGVDQGVTLDVAREAYLALAKTHHPDKGGDRAKWDELERAYQEVREAKATKS